MKAKKGTGKKFPKTDKDNPVDIKIDWQNGRHQHFILNDDPHKTLLLNELLAINNPENPLSITGNPQLIYIPSIKALDGEMRIANLFKIAHKEPPEVYRRKKIKDLKDVARLELMFELADYNRENAVFILDQYFDGIYSLNIEKIREIIHIIKKKNFIAELDRGTSSKVHSDFSPLVIVDETTGKLVITGKLFD